MDLKYLMELQNTNLGRTDFTHISEPVGQRWCRILEASITLNLEPLEHPRDPKII